LKTLMFYLFAILKMSSSDTCITYFTQYTQLDPPVRQINLQGPSGPALSDLRPCDTWICGATTEYECLGIDYNTDTNGNVIGAKYLPLTEWAQKWEGGGCVDLFKSIALGLGTTNNGTFSPLGFRYVQDDFSFMLSRYFNQDPSTEVLGPSGPVGKTSVIPLVPATGPSGVTGPAYVPEYPLIYEDTWIKSAYNLTIPGQPGYNTFLDTLVDACRQIPGACYPTQQFMCNQCSRSEILGNPEIADFCGCVAPPSTAQDYYNQIIGKLNPACDPICNTISSVKNVNPDTGYLNQCSANVCVIDNVIINAIDTKGASPTFTQVCPSCINGGNCLCIIDSTFDNTITSIQGTDGQPINTAERFTQYCPNSQCYENNPVTGQFDEVECANTLSQKLLERSGIAGPPVKFPWWVLIVFAIILVVAIIAIIAYRYQADNIRVYEYIPGRKYKSV